MAVGVDLFFHGLTAPLFISAMTYIDAFTIGLAGILFLRAFCH
jgi:hypothetical protein